MTNHRPLKKLFQEWAIPPWMRGDVPLLYLDGQLAAVPGHLYCEPFVARPGEPAWQVLWKT
jgi:tRNA(Ile)-lysidine synthase